ncbi:PEGA domain-containing protein [Empedobacter brevis]|uniref:PEGA domain-containing protein n=1 Tax=Empedobacter brevis TaxID=247 RepID=UPI0039B0D5AE
MKKLTIALLFGGLFSLTSCATIISGSKQNVSFTSNPSKATVYINESEIGKTPIETKLERKKNYNVKIVLEGYEPFETKLTKKFNAWYIGNILFGGIIGLVIDPITGAMFKLTPQQIEAEMAQGTVFKQKGNDIYFTVKLDIDPSWQKVAQLKK